MSDPPCTCRTPYACDYPLGVEVEMPDRPFDKGRAESHNRKVRLALAADEAGRLREAHLAQIRERLLSADPAVLIHTVQGDVEIANERARLAERQRAEATDRADRYRLLWECAAAVLRHNRDRLRRMPRYGDARRMLTAAEHARGSVSVNTDGWLNWLPDPDPPAPDTLFDLEATGGDAVLDRIDAALGENA